MIGFEFYTCEVKVGNVLHVSETFAYVTTISKRKKYFFTPNEKQNHVKIL